MTAEFNSAKVVITRKRFSVTQGEVLIEFDGQRIEQYGDKIELRDGEWAGYDDAFWIAVAKREALARGLAVEPTPPAPAALGMIRETVRAEGVRDRIKREIFNAAVTPKDAADRSDRLAFWHRLQRSADRVFYLNGAGRKPSGKMTKIESAGAREMASAPRWIGSAEHIAEARAMGISSL